MSSVNPTSSDLSVIKEQIPALLVDLQRAVEDGNMDAIEVARYHLTQMDQRLSEKVAESASATAAATTSLHRLDRQIHGAAAKNRSLVKHRRNVDAETSAASERTEDYEREYVTQYWTNWMMVGDLVLLGVALYKFNSAG